MPLTRRAYARQEQAAPDPKFTAAMQKGEAALKTRRFDEALDAFKQANAIQKKTSAAAFLGIARACHGLGAFKSEAENCAEGLKHAGDDQRLRASLHNQRGMALFSLVEKNTDKEIREAEAEFRSALVLPDSPVIAWYNLGVMLLKQSRDQEGIVALQSYIDSGVRAPETDLARRMIENPAARAGGLLRPTTPSRRRPATTSARKSSWAKPWCSISGERVDYIGKTNMDWPQFLDQNRQVIRMFRVNAYPTYIVVDTEGIVRIRLQGLGPSTFGQLESAIKKASRMARRKNRQP